MQCSRCQHHNRSQARYCGECGAALGSLCPDCGSKLEHGSKFCDWCGASVAGTRVRQAAPARLAAPTSYTPAHLANKILSSRTALEGELKQVTVVHADVKGSTEYVADLDPEQARMFLDPVLEMMMEAVHRYEGTVNQVMGDGIMALFGAPLAYEDHAVRACYSALRMQDSIKKYAEEVRRTHGIPLQVRVGINSGAVLVRSIGNDLHMNYTAQGLTSHLSARMEQMAVPGTILITSDTCRLAGGHVTTKRVGPLIVKGLTGPIEAFELFGANSFISRVEAGRPRGLTSFIGRENEMDQLREALDQVADGHGQVLAIVGEPGVGKSRLIHEFIYSPFTAGCRILKATAVSYGTAASYLPVTHFLKEYFQIATSDKSGEIREKVTSKLLDVDEALLPLLPALLTLLDFSPEDHDVSIQERTRYRQRTLEAVKRLMFRESDAQPLLVVLENLHAIDPETQVLIDGLVDSLSSSRILLLVSYRPEYAHTWGGKAHYAQVRLNPLPPMMARELLDTLVGDDVGLEQLRNLLVEKTEGNPLFLEESVRTLVETGALSGRPGAYCTTSEISQLQVPATLESLLASRIDRLTPVDKRLLQSAAVIGYQVALGVLQSVGEISPDEIRQSLGRLQSSELLYEMRLFPDLEYSFKHALIHDVAYKMLPHDRRLALHNASLAAGEEYYADRLGEKADWLAFHACHAKAWDRAVTHLRAAATRSVARSANRVAADHLENALIAANHLSDPDQKFLAIDLRIELRHALTPLGQVQRTLAHLQTAEQLATELNDKSRLGRVVAFIANCLLLQAKYDAALATASRALQIARELGDARLQLTIQIYMARARFSKGEHRETMDLYRSIIGALDERPQDEFLHLPVLPTVFARCSLAASLAETGLFEEAGVHARDALRRAEASGQPDTIMWALWGMGLFALLQGASEHALSVFERLMEMCTVHDLDAYRSRIMAALGCAKARMGLVREGYVLVEQAVALDKFAEPELTKSFAITALSEAALLAGELDEAYAIANQAVERTRRNGERSAQAYACWLQAIIQTELGANLEPADSPFQTARTIATQLGLRPLLAHCELGLGDMYQRLGFSREASTHRQRGQGLLKELGIKPWFSLNSGLPASL
jgi:class 3 adenylate cyclase/tetratricopeptide (TPR) repeat protein